jgi:hypothetical protein
MPLRAQVPKSLEFWQRGRGVVRIVAMVQVCAARGDATGARSVHGRTAGEGREGRIRRFPATAADGVSAWERIADGDGAKEVVGPLFWNLRQLIGRDKALDYLACCRASFIHPTFHPISSSYRTQTRHVERGGSKNKPPIASRIRHLRTSQERRLVTARACVDWYQYKTCFLFLCYTHYYGRPVTQARFAAYRSLEQCPMGRKNRVGQSRA